jgi:hypothetical protein
MNSTFQISMKGMKPSKKKIKKTVSVEVPKYSSSTYLTGDQFEQNLIKRINRYCDEHGIL